MPHPDPHAPRRPLSGSERAPDPRASVVRPAAAEATFEVTVLVRPREELPAAEVLNGMRIDRDTYAERYSADQADLDAVADFAREHDLQVRDSDPIRRTVVLGGTVAQMSAAFHVTLNEMRTAQGTHRGRTGAVYLPDSLEDVVQGLFNLDDRRQADPRFVVAQSPSGPAHAATHVAFTPPELAAIYDFPTDSDAGGQTIGIIEFGGGYSTADITAYFAELGLPAPAVTAVSVDGVANSPDPTDPNSPDIEVMLDIEVAAAVAPGANVVVYFAPFSERGWVDVLRTAIHDERNNPSVLSISWGWAEGEDLWTRQALDAVDDALKEAAALGVTVLCAAGDDGSADDQTDGRLHVDFPASSPFITGVGGTSLAHWASDKIESVWNDGPRAQGGGAGGGGVSKSFPRPAYQDDVVVPTLHGRRRPGRGVPDVSADADPMSGYRVRVNGRDIVVGGTSAAAPLWAGLISLINGSRDHSVGFLNPVLYSTLGPQGALRDIQVGDNDSGHLGAYAAGPGWDAASGWGVPQGVAIAALLSQAAGQSQPHQGSGSTDPQREGARP